MACYVICTYDIADAKGYEPYVPSVMPLLEKHGAEVLAADFTARAFEGAPPSVQVILKFPSEAAVQSWYDDPAYVEVRKIRIGSTVNGSLVAVRPMAAPAS